MQCLGVLLLQLFSSLPQTQLHAVCNLCTGPAMLTCQTPNHHFWADSNSTGSVTVGVDCLVVGLQSLVLIENELLNLLLR